MSNKLEWNDYYEILCQVKEIEGTINVPIKYEYEGVAIGRWLTRQRYNHSKGKLSREREIKLESLGIVWNANELVAIKQKEEWFRIFHFAELFYQENGHLRMPRTYIVDSVNVGAWLLNMRSAYNGYSKRTLHPYQIEALETIGVEWHFDYKEKQWEEMYQLACEYYIEFGNIGITQDKKYKGKKLGAWIHQQRQSYRRSKLSVDKISKLEAIGMIWFPQINKWETYYKYATLYYNEVGNLDIPDDFVIDGLNLGRWIGVQRQSYNGRQDTILTQEQIDRLNNIGMIWKGDATTQTSFYEQIIYFYVKKKFPNAVNRYSDLGFEIDVFIPDLKLGIEYDGYFWHKDKLDADIDKCARCSAADIKLIRVREKGLSAVEGAINYILGSDSLSEFESVLKSLFIQNLGQQLDSNLKKDTFKIVKNYKVKINSPWYKAYNEAKSYYQEYGNLLVPDKYISPSGFRLGKWIKNQRQCYKGNHTKPLSEEQIALLNEIDMIWDVVEYNWELGYSFAQTFYQKFHHLEVPQNKIYHKFHLGRWIQGQRLEKKVNPQYPQKRVERLNEIGMFWEYKNHAWDIAYKKAESYYEEYGNLLIPEDYITPDGFKLGWWIRGQRNLPSHPKSQENLDRIKLLNQIGMVWDVKEHLWYHHFQMAKQFYETNGHLLVPYTYIIDGFDLGKWIGDLRGAYRENDVHRITTERKKQLDSIGMVWDLREYLWMSLYNLALRYYKENGNVDLPKRFQYEGKNLGVWVYNQKSYLRGRSNSRFSEERIKLLRNIGLE